MSCVTHHYACECREAEFSKARAEAQRLREAIERHRKQNHKGARWRPFPYKMDEELYAALAPSDGRER